MLDHCTVHDPTEVMVVFPFGKECPLCKAEEEIQRLKDAIAETAENCERIASSL